MDKNLLLLLLSTLFLFSVSKADTIEIIKPSTDSFTFNVKIKAIDLSEDGITGASNNDEVFFFIYKQNGRYLPQNLYTQFFVLDTALRTKSFKIKSDAILPTDTLTFILLEKDTKKQIKGIDPICRMYLNELYANYQKNGILKFEEYFDDDDVLGMYRVTGDKFDLKKPIIKKFESLNFFDWSIYKLEISK